MQAHQAFESSESVDSFGDVFSNIWKALRTLGLHEENDRRLKLEEHSANSSVRDALHNAFEVIIEVARGGVRLHLNRFLDVTHVGTTSFAKASASRL